MLSPESARCVMNRLNDSVERKRTMSRFVGYRPAPPEGYVENGYANPPDQPQYEGVIFSDGTVAVRWLTANRSTSLWDSYAAFYAVHGHPEYGTVIVWLDEEED